MDERPKKRRGPLYWLADRSRRFWIIVAVTLPVLYAASLGPVSWLVGDLENANPMAIEAVPIVYYPILWLARITRPEVGPGIFGQSRIDGWIEWYATLMRKDGAYPAHRANGERVWYFKPEDFPPEIDPTPSP